MTTTAKSRMRLNHELTIRLSDWLRNKMIQAWLETGPTLKKVAEAASKELDFNLTPAAIKRIAEAAQVKWEVKKSAKPTKDEQIKQLTEENAMLKARIAELELPDVQPQEL